MCNVITFPFSHEMLKTQNSRVWLAKSSSFKESLRLSKQLQKF